MHWMQPGTMAAGTGVLVGADSSCDPSSTLPLGDSTVGAEASSPSPYRRVASQSPLPLSSPSSTISRARTPSRSLSLNEKQVLQRNIGIGIGRNAASLQQRSLSFPQAGTAKGFVVTSLGLQLQQHQEKEKEGLSLVPNRSASDGGGILNFRSRRNSGSFSSGRPFERGGGNTSSSPNSSNSGSGSGSPVVSATAKGTGNNSRVGVLRIRRSKETFDGFEAGGLGLRQFGSKAGLRESFFGFAAGRNSEGGAGGNFGYGDDFSSRSRSSSRRAVSRTESIFAGTDLFEREAGPVGVALPAGLGPIEREGRPRQRFSVSANGNQNLQRERETSLGESVFEVQGPNSFEIPIPSPTPRFVQSPIPVLKRGSFGAQPASIAERLEQDLSSWTSNSNGAPLVGIERAWSFGGKGTGGIGRKDSFFEDPRSAVRDIVRRDSSFTRRESLLPCAIGIQPERTERSPRKESSPFCAGCERRILGEIDNPNVERGNGSPLLDIEEDKEDSVYDVDNQTSDRKREGDIVPEIPVLKFEKVGLESVFERVKTPKSCPYPVYSTDEEPGKNFLPLLDIEESPHGSVYEEAVEVREPISKLDEEYVSEVEDDSEIGENSDHQRAEIEILENLSRVEEEDENEEDEEEDIPDLDIEEDSRSDIDGPEIQILETLSRVDEEDEEEEEDIPDLEVEDNSRHDIDEQQSETSESTPKLGHREDIVSKDIPVLENNGIGKSSESICSTPYFNSGIEDEIVPDEEVPAVPLAPESEIPKLDLKIEEEISSEENAAVLIEGKKEIILETPPSISKVVESVQVEEISALTTPEPEKERTKEIVIEILPPASDPQVEEIIPLEETTKIEASKQEQEKSEELIVEPQLKVEELIVSEEIPVIATSKQEQKETVVIETSQPIPEPKELVTAENQQQKEKIAAASELITKLREVIAAFEVPVAKPQRQEEEEIVVAENSQSNSKQKEVIREISERPSHEVEEKKPVVQNPQETPEPKEVIPSQEKPQEEKASIVAETSQSGSTPKEFIQEIPVTQQQEQRARVTSAPVRRSPPSRSRTRGNFVDPQEESSVLQVHQTHQDKIVAGRASPNWELVEDVALEHIPVVIVLEQQVIRPPSVEASPCSTFVGEPTSEDIPALRIQDREEEQQQENLPQRELVDEGIAGIPLASSPNSIQQEDLVPREPTPNIPALIVEWDRRESERQPSPVEIHLEPSAPGSPVLKKEQPFELPILESINKIPVLKLDTKEEETDPKEDEEMATLDPGDNRRRGRSKSPGRERSTSRVQQYDPPTERERSRVRAPDPPTSRGYDERDREYGYDDRNVVTAEPRGNYGYREDSPPRKGKYRDDSPPSKYRAESPPRKPKYREESPPKSKSIFKIPGAFKSKADSDDDDDDLAYGSMPGEKKKKRKEKEKEDREYYEREERKYSAAGGKYEVDVEKHKYSTSDGRGRYDNDPGKGKGASFNIGVGQHSISGGVAVVHDAKKPQYAQAPPSPSGYNAGAYKPPSSPAWGQSGYGAPVGYQPPVTGYAPPSPNYAPQTAAYAAAGGTYQPPYSAPQGPPPGRTYAEPPQWEYAQPDPMVYSRQSDTQVGYPARPASPPSQYAGGHSRHGSSYASPHGSSSNVLTVEPGSRRRDPSPGPSSLAPRMHSLSVSTGHHGNASLSLANAPGSPLLEAYHGTYQSISPMPSPLMMPSGHGEVNYIEPLSPGYDSDPDRKGSKTRRTARFHDPVEEAKTLAAALRGEKRGPDVGPLIEILPGLTHEQVMDLRVEYKRIVKTGSEKKGVNVAKHIKLRLKDEDSSLMKACYACALGKWESEAYWANFWYQGEKSRRELLIESLMGRTNAEIRAIKDGFSDKKYSDSLTKCMKTELKEDKFKKAVLLVLEERKMEDRGGVDVRLVEDDVRDLHKAVRSERGGESAMIGIIVVRSDKHLREVLRVYDESYRANFAREMLKKSGNLVGELLAHILNGVINKPVRDALLIHHALSLSRSDSIRTELLISRLVRYHWDRPHMEAVKREYRIKYGVDMRTAVKEGTRGDWGRFCEGLCVRRMGDEVREMKTEVYYERTSERR